MLEGYLSDKQSIIQALVFRKPTFVKDHQCYPVHSYEAMTEGVVQDLSD